MWVGQGSAPYRTPQFYFIKSHDLIQTSASRAFVMVVHLRSTSVSTCCNSEDKFLQIYKDCQNFIVKLLQGRLVRPVSPFKNIFNMKIRQANFRWTHWSWRMWLELTYVNSWIFQNLFHPSRNSTFDNFLM